MTNSKEKESKASPERVDAPSHINLFAMAAREATEHKQTEMLGSDAIAMSESKRDILHAYRESCLKKGAVLEVDPAHYRWFVELTEGEMGEMIRLILLDRSTEIKRWI